MKTKIAQTKINIRVGKEGEEVREVAANRIGPLAFHPKYETKYKVEPEEIEYAVTHIQSGGLLFYCCSEKVAKELIHFLLEKRFDWDFTHPAGSRQQKEIKSAILEFYKNTGYPFQMRTR